MTTLTWNIDFISNIVVDKDIIPNKYDVTVELLTNTSDAFQQNVAFDRMKVFCNNVLHSSVLVSIDNPLIQTLLDDFDTNIIIFPDDPYDQILSITLFSKLSAIMEGRMIINNLSLSSYQGSNLKYTFNLDEYEYPPVLNIGMLAGELPWWKRSDMSAMDIITKDDSGEYKLEKQDLNWEHINLLWDSNVQKEGKIIQINKFKPKIIEKE